MGYGEFGGGGSVHWKIDHGGNTKQHNDTIRNRHSEDAGHVHRQGKGRTAAAAQSRTTFDSDGNVRITFAVDHANKKQIRLVWTP